MSASGFSDLRDKELGRQDSRYGDHDHRDRQRQRHQVEDGPLTNQRLEDKAGYDGADGQSRRASPVSMNKSKSTKDIVKGRIEFHGIITARHLSVFFVSQTRSDFVLQHLY